MNKAFRRLSLDKVINKTLGIRSSVYNSYRWDEIFSALLDVYLCCGSCVEDVNRRECHLRENPDVRIPTSHTVGRAIKELACADTEYTADSGKVYRFNANARLNGLLMRLNMEMGLLRRGQVIDVDFDHVFLKAEKYDAEYSYKRAYGYFPGVVSVNGVIAYVENRDGNTPVKFHQADTLGRAFDLFRTYGLCVNVFRADCGSYNEEIVRTVDSNCHTFYIRAANSAAMYASIQAVREWREVEIGFQRTEVASFLCTHFMEDAHYRVVVQRTEVKDGEPDLFGGRYVYRCILTNDWESKEEAVIGKYNGRGARECDFSRLNNDFGWKRMPCSLMRENTAFMILTAICMNFFSYFVGAVAAVFKTVYPRCRVKRLLFGFIAVCAKWTRTARTWRINLYTGLPYDKLAFG